MTGYASFVIGSITLYGTRLVVFQSLEKAVTQLRLGGVDGKSLYLVTVPADAAVKLASGRAPERMDSGLLRCKVDVAGLVPQPA